MEAAVDIKGADKIRYVHEFHSWCAHSSDGVFVYPRVCYSTTRACSI